ncbi:MAG: DMT family transporter [Cardiobacteriaceae bacterium]|nr:DMT family transporter [Cardiobacteriaceae bacterium]
MDTVAKHNATKYGVLLAIIGSITFSGKAIIVKLGFNYGADPITMLFWRMTFALPFFILMAWWASRDKQPLSFTEWFEIAILGFLGFYLASFLDFAGLKYITASLERLILCVQPTLVLLFGWLLKKNKVNLYHILGIVISYTGIFLVFGQEAFSGSNKSVSLGTFLIFLSTISYALYLLFSGEIVKKIGSMRLVGLATSFACIYCIIHFLVTRSPKYAFQVAPEVIWLSLLNGFLCTVVPVLTTMMSVERIGAANSSQIGMLGPIFVITLGVLILDEPFTLFIVACALLVICGIFIFLNANKLSNLVFLGRK